MAGTLSTALNNELLDHIFQTGAFAVPANIYVALYTTAPTAAGGGTEVSGNGYARRLHNSWDTAASGATENAGAVTFATASGGNWGTVVAFGLFDAVTGGNFLGWGDLTLSKSIDDGDTAEFADGTLDVSIT